jgi:hypothetical protein
VAAGEVTAFSATLRIATDAAYGRLSANALSKRTVRLQRRPLSSTTWSTIATMNAASPTGTYALSLTLFATADYRAVFSTPTSEGLRGDTTATIRVTVLACMRVC